MHFYQFLRDTLFRHCHSLPIQSCIFSLKMLTVCNNHISVGHSIIISKYISIYRCLAPRRPWHLKNFVLYSFYLLNSVKRSPSLTSITLKYIPLSRCCFTLKRMKYVTMISPPFTWFTIGKYRPIYRRTVCYLIQSTVLCVWWFCQIQSFPDQSSHWKCFWVKRYLLFAGLFPENIYLSTTMSSCVPPITLYRMLYFLTEKGLPYLTIFVDHVIISWQVFDMS